MGMLRMTNLSVSTVAVKDVIGLACAQLDATRSTRRKMDSDDSFEIPITTSVPDYGLIALGLHRNGSYEAAKAGKIPVIEVQGKKRVPVRVALARMADGDPEILRALTADFAAKFSRLKAGQAA
jgi:hypothetical protein